MIYLICGIAYLLVGFFAVGIDFALQEEHGLIREGDLVIPILLFWPFFIIMLIGYKAAKYLIDKS